MPLRDLVLVLLIVLAWAGNFLTSALALREIPPFLFTALRFALLALPLVFVLHFGCLDQLAQKSRAQMQERSGSMQPTAR